METIANSQYVAMKMIRVGEGAGVQIDPGFRVDVGALPDHKIAQLLRQRLIRPALAGEELKDMPAPVPEPVPESEPEG